MCIRDRYGDLNGLLRKDFVTKSEFSVPKKVAKGRSRDFAEIGDSADDVRMSYLPPKSSLPYEIQTKLALLNDSGEGDTGEGSCRRWTFGQIATWIEENL